MSIRKLFFVFFLLSVVITAGAGCGGGNSMTSSASPAGGGNTGGGSGGGATGIATLAWNAPATNVDGTPLTNLAGYKVYYGTASGSYTSVVNVGKVTSYTINNLASGTYYFAVTAYDTVGLESGYSNEAAKTIM